MQRSSCRSGGLVARVTRFGKLGESGARASSRSRSSSSRTRRSRDGSGVGDHSGDGVRRRRHRWRATDVLGWLDPTIGSESVRWVAEATLTVVLFSDASRIDLAALRREYVVPLRLLAIGLPLTIVAGALAGVAVFGQLAFIEAVLACDRARPDGRCARAGGRHRPPDSVARPPGPQRRERAQRRHLRPAAPDRDRDRRGSRRARSDTARRCTSCSRRSATDASAAWLRGSQPRSWSG